MLSSIFAVGLKTENLCNPLGINITEPEFSWVLDPASIPHEQSAWQIRAASGLPELENGPWLWDSGKIPGTSACGHVWTGKPLGSRDQVFWQVRLWDESGAVSAWSAAASFELGLLTNEEWDCSWMGYPAGWGGSAQHQRMFFDMPETWKKARLYVSGPCWHEAFMNQVKLGGNIMLQPSQSNFDKSIHYTAYDITQAVHPGKNVLAFHLGYGWYGACVFRFRMEVDGKLLASTHFRSQLLHAEPSSIIRHSLYGGEEFDARFGLDTEKDWMQDDSAKRPESRRLYGYIRIPISVPGPHGKPRGLEEEPIRPEEEYTVRKWITLSDGRLVADFGVNFAGFCRLRVKAPAGTRIEMLFAESLHPDGSVNQDNLLGDYSRDVYTAAGTGNFETWQPHFVYHGFRFVEVRGLPGAPEADTLIGVALRTDCRSTGKFSCSNELVSRIWEMIRHTEECNIHAVPTDCPQRTERMGWLNDMMARCEGAMYMFDESNVITKWLRDIADGQDPETGEIAMMAPVCGPMPIDPVCSSFIDSAWYIHAFYGKTSILKELYPAQRKWVDFMLRCCDGNGIFSMQGDIGDWVPPAKFNNNDPTPVNQTVPHPLVSTALMHYAIRRLALCAGILGYAGEKNELETIAAKVRADFKRAFSSGFGRLQQESQSGYAFALYCGMFNEDESPAAAARLAELFRQNGCKHTTGNIGTKYLIETLSEYGYSELVWQLLLSVDYPGWGYMLENGATTLWERWEKLEGIGMNSHNHPMLGAPAAWLFRHLAGIRITEETCGFDRFVLSPEFPSGLNHAEAEYDSRAGLVRAAWHRNAAEIVYDFDIPAGSRAKVRMPSGDLQEFRSGHYSVSYPV